MDLFQVRQMHKTCMAPEWENRCVRLCLCCASHTAPLTAVCANRKESKIGLMHSYASVLFVVDRIASPERRTTKFMTQNIEHSHLFICEYECKCVLGHAFGFSFFSCGWNMNTTTHNVSVLICTIRAAAVTFVAVTSRRQFSVNK